MTRSGSKTHRNLSSPTFTSGRKEYPPFPPSFAFGLSEYTARATPGGDRLFGAVGAVERLSACACLHIHGQCSPQGYFAQPCVACLALGEKRALEDTPGFCERLQSFIVEDALLSPSAKETSCTTIPGSPFPLRRS